MKENNKLVQLTARVLEDASIEQYKREERSLLAKRATSEKDRLNELLSCMKNDTLSPPEKMKQLRKGLLELTGDVNFKKSKNMGEILESALDFIVRNYETENPFL